MTAVNATGLRAMEGFADAVDASGRMLLVCGAPPQPARLMARGEFHRHVDAENILPNVESVLARASNSGVR
jgi:SulP family sulfate permease